MFHAKMTLDIINVFMGGKNMRKNKREVALNQVDQLLTELFDELTSAKAKAAVQRAYNTIHRQKSLNMSYKMVPDAITTLKKEFSHLSLTKQVRFTRAQEELVSRLTVFTRKAFQHGFEGLMFINVWSG